MNEPFDIDPGALPPGMQSPDLPPVIPPPPTRPRGRRPTDPVPQAPSPVDPEQAAIDARVADSRRFFNEKYGDEIAQTNKILEARGELPIGVIPAESPPARPPPMGPSSSVVERGPLPPPRTPPPHPSPRADQVQPNSAVPPPSPPEPPPPPPPPRRTPAPNVRPPSETASVIASRRPDPAVAHNPYLATVSFEEVWDMPSRGLTYPPGTKVTYRNYTLGELEQLEASTLTRRDRHLLALRGIETAGIDKLQLTAQDTLYASLLRRISTMGAETLVVQTVCPRCGGSNDTKVATLDVTGSKDKMVVFDTFKAEAFPIRAKLSTGAELEFWPATIGEVLAAMDRGIEITDHVLLAMQCHTLDFPESIEQLAEVSHPRDQRILARITELLHHTISPLDITCPQQVPDLAVPGLLVPCNQRYRRDLSSEVDAFIYPFRSPEDDVDALIEFGAGR